MDLDGTLIRSDGNIAAEDLAALDRAHAAGLRVVVTTGRLPPSGTEVARSIGHEDIIVCADGAFLLQANAPLQARWVPDASSAQLVALAVAHGLRLFAFGERSVHYHAQDAAFLPYVQGFAHAADLRPGSWTPGPFLMLLALGSRDPVERAVTDLLINDRAAQVDHFALAPSQLWALRLRPAKTDKGEALLRVCQALTIPAERLFAVGNDYNDVPLFRVAARSFAMADAPPPVQLAATRVLLASSVSGGGVAEAVAHLLG